MRTTISLQSAYLSLQQRVRELHERSPLMYLVLDAQGVVLDANPRALAGLGRPVTELVGTRLRDLLDPEEPEGIAALDQALVFGETLRPIELRLCTPAGALFTSATVSATRAADGTAVEFQVMMLDISEVRILQQRMVHADRLASVGQLAAGVAHEINNPAAFVMSNLSYLEGHVPALQRLLPLAAQEGHESWAGLSAFLAELPDLCAQTLGGMRRIRDIVRDLQLFARERHAHDPPEPVDLNRLCDTVANMAWPEVRRRARLEKNYGVVPAFPGHPGKLSQVLLNLIINAAQAIPEGQQERNKIVLSTEVQGDWATCAVRDTGCGIPRTVMARIFDPFFTTKPPGKGTGLGLAVSHEIVARHGGRIEVQSEVGKGTTVTVWLPMALSASASATTPTSTWVSAPASSRGKVLVVDDEPELLRALTRVLRPEHEVLVAGSGAEGREQLLRHGDIDVVLCDVTMPQVSGIDLYESLPRPLRERFIFLSGDTASLAARLFLESVRQPHLDKPVESDLLLRTIGEAVSRTRAGKAPS